MFCIVVIILPPNFSFLLDIAWGTTGAGVDVLVAGAAKSRIRESCCITVPGFFCFALVTVVGEVAAMGITIELASVVRRSFLFVAITTTSIGSVTQYFRYSLFNIRHF
jgi:hypothetical protein